MKRLFKYIFKYIFFYIAGCIVLGFIDFLQLSIPRLIGLSVDSLKTGGNASAMLFNFIIQIFAITIIVTAGRLIWRVVIFGTSRHIEYRIKNDLFSHLEKLSLKFYNKNKTGDLMAYFTNDLASVRMMIGPGIIMVFDAVLLITLVIYKTVTGISLTLTLLALIPLPVISIGALFFGKVLQKRFKEKQEAFAKLTDFVQESLSGIRVIKAFVQEYRELSAYQKVNEDNFNKNFRLIKTYSFLFPLVGFIVGLSLLITMIYGSYLTVINTITLGSFIAFIQYIDLMIWPMVSIGWSINIFSQGIASQKRIDQLFNNAPDITESENTPIYTKAETGIIIKNLKFAYPEQKDPVLDGISFEIKSGASLAIVGRTGSGKTTIANMLVRLYNPPEDTVFIGGCDILDFPLDLLKRTVCCITQDTILFSDSIKNNIILGLDKDPGNDKIILAAKNASIHDNITELSDKYETVIGEKGITLSGGQKQRLTISRALITEPDILIIDDSLSAVDTKTEEDIISNLQNIRKKKTTVIIAHRMSTIQFADKIIVLENGRITENGTHKQLIRKNGFYSKLYKKQQIEKELEND